MVNSPTPALRILLETDAPYMVPANLYSSLTSLEMKGKRLPLCHTGMIPWTASFVAETIQSCLEGNPGDSESRQEGGEVWGPDRVMKTARCNANAVYGV